MRTPNRARARLTFHETEESLRLLLDGVRDYAIFLLDPGGHVLTWNAGAERIEGYAPDEIIGQHCSRFYPPEHRRSREPERELELAAKTGRMQDEGWRVRKDGSRFWANAVITAVRGPDGAVAGFAQVIRDLTEQKRAEEALRRSEERFRLLVESVKDYAIFLLDPVGRVTTWSPGAERMKGYPAHEIVGRHFSVFYTPEDLAADKPESLLRAATEAGRVEDKGWRVRRDGSRFWADVVLTAIRDHKSALLGFAKITRDLTEQKRAQEELARSNAELEGFSYSVSHDLRAPLRAINGYAQALLQDHAASLNPEGRRLLNVVRDNAKQLGQLIDALLRFSRLGRQPLHTVPIDMTTLVGSVLEDLRPAAGGSPPEVSVEPLPQALGDKTLIRQVLANLIDNAFKFSRTRPHRRVTIGGHLEDDKAIYFVRDNGVGFDMRYADKLFQVFTRLHRVEEVEGTGVGLALVQRIVHRHGGRVWAESAVDQGATFYFTLPREADRGKPKRRDSEGQRTTRP